MGSGFDALRQLQNPIDQAASDADRRAEQAKAQATNHARQGNIQQRPLKFHNPYNFVPAVPREDVPFDLGDRAPTSHSSYADQNWSGRLSINLTTKTPLLVPDAAKTEKVGQSGHLSFPLRMVNDQPYLAPTSIKGMLRSAYEAVTNSRLSVFQGHGDRLAYRMDARDGLSLVPVRIGPNEKSIELLLGTTNGIPTRNRDRWTVPNSLMYAAWLPSYENKSERPSPDAVTCKGMHHGQKVKAWVQRIERHPFSYWRVCPNGMVPADKVLKPTPEKWQAKRSRNHQPTDQVIPVEGYLCITGKNIGRKYHERLFFNDPGLRLRHPLVVQLTSDESTLLKREWQELIKNYQEEHQSDIDKGQMSAPQAENNAQWSKFITGQRGISQNQELLLREGTLCYAKVEETAKGFKVIALCPVMIARTLFSLSPDELLSDGLKPATSISELSPADRVFGWASQTGRGAHRGQLRIHSVECVSKTPIKHFTSNPKQDPGLALGILGQPKPTQTRFYVAQDSQGTPLKGAKKQDGYENHQGLRGRKVYPHHTVGIHEQEYARPEQERDSQNRSIQAWVKPDSKFQYQIDVTNLSDVEMGGLLWLLQLPPDHYHRLGGGKPFGFGSVSLSINWEQSDLRLGEAWRQYYSVMGKQEPANSSDNLQKQADLLVDKFKESVRGAYGNNQQILPSFLQMAKGFEDSLPVHYPRNHPQATLDDENFQWFESNEASDRLALPLLIENKGLPYFSEKDDKPQNGGGRNPQPKNPQPRKPPQQREGKVPPPVLKKKKPKS